MDALMTKIGVINDRGSDGFTLMAEFSDGTQGELGGWWGARSYALEAAQERADDYGAYDHNEDGNFVLNPHGVVVEDWTAEEAFDDGDDEE